MCERISPNSALKEVAKSRPSYVASQKLALHVISIKRRPGDHMFVHEAQSDWFDPTPKFRGDFFGRNFYVYPEFGIPRVGIPSDLKLKTGRKGYQAPVYIKVYVALLFCSREILCTMKNYSEIIPNFKINGSDRLLVNLDY